MRMCRADSERLAVDALSRMARICRYSSDGYSHPLLASRYVDMSVAVGQQPWLMRPARCR